VHRLFFLVPTEVGRAPWSACVSGDYPMFS
jgi:hypothetical protein